MWAVDMKPTCRARSPTGQWLGSFCRGDDHSSASCPTPPSPPGGHSWTHSLRRLDSEPWRASNSNAWGWEQSLKQPCSVLLCSDQERERSWSTMLGMGQAWCAHSSVSLVLPCLLRPTVCPCWCPRLTSPHSWWGCPCTQAAPCPLPTWDSPHPCLSLLMAWTLNVRGRKRATEEALLSHLPPRGPHTGLRVCWALRSRHFQVWDGPATAPWAWYMYLFTFGFFPYRLLECW